MLKQFWHILFKKDILCIITEMVNIGHTGIRFYYFCNLLQSYSWAVNLINFMSQTCIGKSDPAIADYCRYS